MEDRSITLDFVKGEIKGVYLKASLDTTYKRLFTNACKASKRYPKNVAHGIKVIIFGCFWIEAYANEILKIILHHGISYKELEKEIWSILKKTSIEDKLSFFPKLLPPELQKEYQTLKNPVKQAFDLRGKLAHYKNEPIRIAEETSPEKVIDILRRPPIPEINQQLMWDKISIHAKAIENINEWLEKIEKRYYKTKNINLNKKETITSKST
jgi:hypothetical protein